MTMILYGRLLSPYVVRVVLAARFKGMIYTLVPPPPGGTRSPEFLKINPLGKIPVLKDGKNVICESSVIVEYLEAKRKTKKLIPKSAKAAAAARLIAAVAGEYVHEANRKLFAFMGRSVEDPKALQAAAAELGAILDILENMMVRGKYATGSRFSIADVYLVPAMYLVAMVAGALGLPDLGVGRPKLKKYVATMQKDKIAGDVLKGMAADWKLAASES